MDTGILLLFVIAISIHNVEEAIWLPGRFATAGRFKRTVSKKEFAFAVIVVTTLA